MYLGHKSIPFFKNKLKTNYDREYNIMFFVSVMKLIGLVILLKGFMSIGIWSLLGLLTGALIIYLGYKIEREYI